MCLSGVDESVPSTPHPHGPGSAVDEEKRARSPSSVSSKRSRHVASPSTTATTGEEQETGSVPGASNPGSPRPCSPQASAQKRMKDDVGLMTHANATSSSAHAPITNTHACGEASCGDKKPRKTRFDARSPHERIKEEERDMIGKFWPPDLLQGREPLYVDDPAEFCRILLTEEYIERMVVLRDGLAKLDLPYEECIPEPLRRHFDASSSVYDFFERMATEETAGIYKARCQYIEKQADGLNHQKEVCGGDNCIKLKIEKVMDRCSKVEPSAIDAFKSRLYVTELRLNAAAPHPLNPNEKVKTVLYKGMKDVLGRSGLYSAYWDRYDEGMFVGGPSSGKSFHVDQVLWCNVGKNYKGYKLVAAWPKSMAKVCDKRLDVLITPPVSEEDLALLKSASIIALIRPGDVYYFCGGIPHMTLSISDELNVSSYESYVTFNRTNLQFFLMGSDEYMGKKAHLAKEALMPECELEDIKDDIVDRMQFLSHVILGNEKYPTAYIGSNTLGLRESLDRMIPQLNRMFIDAINLMSRDFYIRKELPRRVYEAIYFLEDGVKADAFTDDEDEPSCDEPAVKKQKIVGTELSTAQLPLKMAMT